MSPQYTVGSRARAISCINYPAPVEPLAPHELSECGPFEVATPVFAQLVEVVQADDFPNKFHCDVIFAARLTKPHADLGNLIVYMNHFLNLGTLFGFVGLVYTNRIDVAEHPAR